MSFVLKLPVHLDRAIAVIAAQKGSSKNAIVVCALEEYLWNNMVIGDSDDVPAGDN